MGLGQLFSFYSEYPQNWFNKACLLSSPIKAGLIGVTTSEESDVHYLSRNCVGSQHSVTNAASK
jgi:hypothetical protein